MRAANWQNRHMNTYGERLRVAIEEEEKTPAWLASRIGTTRQGLGQVLLGKAKTLNVNTHFEAAAALKISSEWLATGVGEMRELTKHHQIPTKHTPDSVLIPQYDTGGKMGNGLVLRDQAGVINGMNVNQEWLQKNVPHCTSPKNLAIVTGFGDSMKGIFNSGDPLLVDKGVTTCEYDGIYFFRVGNEGYIKRLQRIPMAGIRVISKNTDYETWTITPDMDFEVFAKVLKAWTGENY